MSYTSQYSQLGNFKNNVDVNHPRPVARYHPNCPQNETLFYGYPNRGEIILGYDLKTCAPQRGQKPILGGGVAVSQLAGYHLMKKVPKTGVL
jgi:hypothetical protein